MLKPLEKDPWLLKGALIETLNQAFGMGNDLEHGLPLRGHVTVMKLKIVHRGMHVAYGCLLSKYSAWPCRSKDAMIFDIE